MIKINVGEKRFNRYDHSTYQIIELLGEWDDAIMYKIRWEEGNEQSMPLDSIILDKIVE